MKGRAIVFVVFSVLCTACSHEPTVVEDELPDPIVATYEEDPIEDFAEIEEEDNDMDSMNAALFESDLKTQLAFLEVYDYFENESLEVDELCVDISDQLTAYLKENELTKKQSDSLGLELCIDKVEFNAIKIFNFSFHCGGTRGLISHPIIQWISLDGQLCSYDFSEDINCYFSEIYSLSSPDKTLYLLLGQESGSGACLQNMAYCVQIKGDSLITTNPVFVNRPYLNICNLEFEFNQESEILMAVNEYDMDEDLSANVQAQGIYSESDSANRALINLMDGLYSESQTILMGFTGQKFEKRY